MKRAAGILGLVLAFAVSGGAQTRMETEPVKELVPTNTLGTCRYRPTTGEDPFFQKLAAAERSTGSLLEDYDINSRQGYVSWFGIVRGIAEIEPGLWRLLIEHKFFDGMTDCHIMLVDIGGSGDYCADIMSPAMTIPALALVRVYGTVSGRAAGRPIVAAEFVRTWPWQTFTFADLAKSDRTETRWKRLRAITGRGIYRPWPDEGYYRAVLGDPKDFGSGLKR